MQGTNSNNTPKLNNAITLLQDAFSEYKGKLERGDIELIAKKSGQKERTVQAYIAGEVRTVETGKNIFAAMREIVLARDKEIKKLVA